jgi:hypothetical protein
VRLCVVKTALNFIEWEVLNLRQFYINLVQDQLCLGMSKSLKDVISIWFIYLSLTSGELNPSLIINLDFISLVDNYGWFIMVCKRKTILSECRFLYHLCVCLAGKWTWGTWRWAPPTTEILKSTLYVLDCQTPVHYADFTDTPAPTNFTTCLIILLCSLFRLTDMNAAMHLFRVYTGKLLPLIVADRNLIKKKTLQEMCDALREHPTWLCAHVAAHLGLMDCFRHNLILQ